MKVLVVLILIVSASISQETLRVYTFDKSDKFAQFEIELINNAVLLYEKKYKTKINVEFVAVEEFKRGFDELESDYAKKNPSLYINKVSYTKERDELYDYSPAYMFNTFSVLSSKGTKKITKYVKGKRFGAVKGTVFVSHLEEAKKTTDIEIVLFESLLVAADGLKTKKIDFLLTDYIDSWSFGLQSNFNVDESLKDRLCILYPNEVYPEFKKKFNSVLVYYTRSQKYFKQINS